jgi:hypothetical protein
MNQPIAWLVFIAVPSVILLLAGMVPFYRYTGLSRDTAFLALLGSFIVGGYQSIKAAHAIEPLLRSSHDRDNANIELFLGIASVSLLYPLLTAFILRLWGRWVGGKATDEEREPGAAGIRAWFSAANVTIGVLLVLCAHLGYGISPLVSTVIAGAVLAAYPALRMETTASATSAAGHAAFASVPKPPAEDLSAEREKILSMLEAGKLTPEESAELLQALGESSRRSAATPIPLTSHQRLMLIGAAIVALGFFLPWFTINPGKEATRLMGQMKFNMPIPDGGTFSMDGSAPGNGLQLGTSGLQLNTGSISYSGGDIQRGLGWATLALALTAALLPYVATTIDPHAARTIRLLCLGIGAFIIFYLLSQSIRFVGIGLIIAAAGYALEITGALRERRAVTA